MFFLKKKKKKRKKFSGFILPESAFFPFILALAVLKQPLKMHAMPMEEDGTNSQP